MVAKIKTFLRSLSEIPEGKFPPSHYHPTSRRIIYYGNFSYFTASVFLSIFALVWLVVGVYAVALISFMAIPVSIVAFVLHRNGYFLSAHFLHTIVTISIVVICLLMLGFEAGFQYILIPSFVTAFYTPWKLKVKIIFAGSYLAAYIGSYLYLSNADHFITINPIILETSYQIHILLLFTIFAFMAHTYSKMAVKSDKKLYAAHQKTMAALEERDQVLEKLNDELSEAADYVKKILPSPLTNGIIRTNWIFSPSTSLGGDAFGYHKVDEENFAFYLIDVSGHGVGAALLSASVINVIRSQSLPMTDFKDPEQVLKALNTAFPSESNKDMFFTIWYGVFNIKNRELTYASAGHPPALLCDNDNFCKCNINLLKTPNFVVGGVENAIYVKDKCKIYEGNSLYIFSDGVYEIEKSDGSKWRFSEFVDFVKKVGNDRQSVLDQWYKYSRMIGKSENFQDDFTIVEVLFC